jgi:N-acetylmuramoyl-L-alanine amidase
MRFTLIPLWVLLSVGAPNGLRGDPLHKVTAVRYYPRREATRVVIEVSGDFDFHSERAHNPERIFFDIFRARPRIDGRQIYAKAFDDRLLKKVRVAETLAGVTRVVLDLQGTADYTATQLTNPARLAIELRPAGSAAPAVPPAPLVTQNLPPTVAAATPPALVESPATLVPAHPSWSEPRVPADSTSESSRAAKMASSGANSLTRALGLKIRRVVLDPGHGGHDEGTSGPSGLLEKDLVLDVALRLGKLIESRMGSEVIYTRSDDRFIPLDDRTAFANDKKADLFLSIHANSSPYPHIGGVESYYLNFTTAKDAMVVAARENATSDKSVFDLRDLTQKITLNDKLEESKEFARLIQASLFPFAARYEPGIKNRGVKKAPFIVLIGAHMPSVLVEIGFLSDAKEETLLRNGDHRQRLAEALYRGVSRYAQGLSHFEVAQAADRVKN